ncbi:C45 family autoproteolytic acyltransferase/hydolase [Candidatus Pantoea multigeneris]|uniref:Acyl-CoA--6-aminopenicillanic acid acyl-transferase n=1 Tax=Candidatus Pantoea multigeneris TaxID=2608357 RepID=A0ABX0RE76_9GAMM|nr:C45 family peptidase [Pantoea multigeneris]NIF23660.1 acyl-CoA--6-aminopenicillanic acid acyl-transferase [Pantoea multigeneris]
MKTINLSGSAWDIGHGLGLAGREAWHQQLRQTSLWQTVTAMGQSSELLAMEQRVRERFPAIWQEIEGLAAGLEAPVSEVFAWNCRGDLVPSTSDGCTTVTGSAGRDEWIIAHNEDGFPQLRNACFLVRVRPEKGLAFLSFAYPGSLCGHTFALNEKGLVNTVNNIRAQVRPAGLPRQILARASLNAETLQEAVEILTSSPRAGAFHHTLGQAGFGVVSVEACGTGCSVAVINTVSGHANHLIHPEQAATLQTITASSGERQACLDRWLETQSAHLRPEAALTVLSSQENAQLPVYRLDPQDPDDENTLATAIFHLTTQGVSWELFGLDRQQAENSGLGVNLSPCG